MDYYYYYYYVAFVPLGDRLAVAGGGVVKTFKGFNVTKSWNGLRNEVELLTGLGSIFGASFLSSCGLRILRALRNAVGKLWERCGELCRSKPNVRYDPSFATK